MTPEMTIVAVCQEMGWTYYEYMEQPSWFLELVETKLVLDNEKTKKEMQKARKSN